MTRIDKFNVHCGKCKTITPTTNLEDCSTVYNINGCCVKSKKYTGNCSVCGIYRSLYVTGDTLYTVDYIGNSTKKNYLDKDSVDVVDIVPEKNEKIVETIKSLFRKNTLFL